VVGNPQRQFVVADPTYRRNCQTETKPSTMCRLIRLAIQCFIDDQEKHNTIAVVVECPQICTVQYVVVRE
jgi:hypothetical protein